MAQVLSQRVFLHVKQSINYGTTCCKELWRHIYMDSQWIREIHGGLNVLGAVE